MPYVKITTSRKLDAEKRDAVRACVWDAITLLPGKTPEVTMVEIQSGADIMKGPGGAPAIFAETRVFTNAPFTAKEAYIKKLTALLNDLTGVEPAHMYFNIMEFNEWGSGGRYNKF